MSHTNVYWGPKLPDDSIEVPEPVIVVEIASPSTRKIDASLKLTGYFSLPSVRHYLIVDPDGPPLIHHRRQNDGTILTSIVHEGALMLDHGTKQCLENRAEHDYPLRVVEAGSWRTIYIL